MRGLVCQRYADLRCIGTISNGLSSFA